MRPDLEQLNQGPQRERRSFDIPLRPAQTRAVGDTKNLTMDIRASTYWVVDYYGTCRAPGAFASMEQDMDLFQVLLHHNPYQLIGFLNSWDAEGDGFDVTVEIVDDDTGPGHSTIAGIRGGLRYQASFGFDVTGARMATTEDPLDLSHAPAWCREDPTSTVLVHTAVKTWEASPVTWGADYTAKPTDVRRLGNAAALDAVIAGIRDGSLEDRQLSALLAAAEERSRGETPPTPGQVPTAGHARSDDAILASLLTATVLGG